MDSVLQQMRQLNTVFNRSAVSFVPLKEICLELSRIIRSNIYIFEPEGTIDTWSIAPEFICPYTEYSLADDEMPAHYLELFRANEKPLVNQYENNPICTYKDVRSCRFTDRYYSLYPIYTDFRKSAGILLIRYGEDFSEPDQILCEYACAILSMDMMRRAQEQIRQKEALLHSARSAAQSLTFSEIKAAEAILEETDGGGGSVFFNAIARKTFVTQSTITGAVKKLESAGVLITRNQGVKGKRIRITNPFLKDEIALARKEKSDAHDQT